MNIENNRSNFNFRAHLNINELAANKTRWKTVASHFKEQTKAYPNDLFIAEGSFNKGFRFVLIDEKNSNLYSAKLPKQISTRLSDLEDSELCKYFTLIYKVLRDDMSCDRTKENVFDSIVFERYPEKKRKEFNDTFEKMKYAQREKNLKGCPVLEKFLEF